MKRVLQIALVIAILLFSIGASLVCFIAIMNKGLSLFEKPEFLFFVFMMVCSLTSAFYKLSYARTLFSHKRSSEQIIDALEFTEAEAPIIQGSKIKTLFFFLYLVFGLCLIGSAWYLFDLSHYSFNRGSSFRTEEFSIISGLFLLGITVLIDSVLTRPWKKLTSPQE